LVEAGAKGPRDRGNKKSRTLGHRGERTGDQRVAKILRRVQWFVLLIAMAGTLTAVAESPDGAGADGDDAGNPVAQVRKHQDWEYGPFVNWGSGVGNRSDFKFLWGGFVLGKVLTPVVHAGILSGQFQFSGNIMPLWQAYTPAPHDQEYTCVTPSGQEVGCILPTGGGTFYGVSLTPVIFRWNFATRSRRFQPWFQAAGGLIYTTHKFPPNILSDPALGIDGGTSVWNFSPQGGGGIHYFFRERRSIDLGVNGVHISSASLGDRNPGVNASVQVQVGYTFWH
jgi:lipid A 3-O-deacylase